MTGVLSDIEANHSRDILVAVVDGNADHRAQVSRALTSFYRVADFGSTDQAMARLANHPPCVVLVDERAPPHGGQAFVRQVRADVAFRGVHVICTTQAGGSEHAAGPDAWLEKPFRRSTLLKTISALVNRSVEQKWEGLKPGHRDVLRNTVDVFNGISDLIERGEPLEYRAVNDACAPLVEAVSNNDYKLILQSVRGHDNYSYVHSLRVATLLSLFGYTIGLPKTDLQLLASGGLDHDIGKMSIPHEVLNKPGKLTPEEWGVMKSHVPRSVDHLLHSDVPRGVITIASQHHEKLNGAGYPAGLKGSELNELARMASIVDVFSALTDRRVYKPPMAPEQALALMSDQMGSELDMGLLKLFRGMLLEAASDSFAA
ncbi:MAG: HD domain-containing phosphohydrolase [Pseudomonadota bacterium]